MEVIAKTKYVRQSPRKLRLVAGKIRGLSTTEAERLLASLNKKAAKAILLALKQGVGNAVNNFQLQENRLKVKVLEINEGPRYKRMDKAHRSFRWGTIQKKTAHIRLILEGEKEKVIPKSVKKKKSSVKKRSRLSLKKKNKKTKT